MKIKKVVYLIFFAIVIVCLNACSNNQEQGYSYKGLTVYPVKITKVKTDSDGDFVIKGTTEAPKGAKILAQDYVEDDQDTNNAESSNEEVDGYEKVNKKHKFSIAINANDVNTKDDVKNDQKIKVKIFAVVGYKVNFDDYVINKKLRTAIKKAKIKPVTLKANKKLEKYWADNSSSDESEDDSDSDDEEIKLYKTKFQSAGVDGTDIIIKGTTNAPDGSLIIAQSKMKTWNDTNMIDNSETIKSKNHNFTFDLDVNGLYGKKLTAGQKLPVRILAVGNYTGKTPIFKFNEDLKDTLDLTDIGFDYVTVPSDLVPNEDD